MKMEDNYEIHREQEDAHTSVICKRRAMFIQLTRFIIALADAVIMAQRAMQGQDDISFLVLWCLLLFSQFGALLGYSLFLVTSFTAIILYSIVSIRPCCKGSLK
jgi:hypothetical protein